MARYDQVCDRWIAVQRGRHTRNLGNERMWGEGNRLYSYGRHFTLAIARPWGILLNGDRFSPTTTRHQGCIRDACERAGETYIIVPFAALRSAGIDPLTVSPIEVRPDRWETVKHSDGTQTQRHRLGDCVFMAGVSQTVHHYVEIDVGPRVEYPIRYRMGKAWKMVPAARPTLRRARFVSSFDYSERNPLYFLAELPRGCKAKTVDEAIDALAPECVHLARARGLDVKRQGDIFAIPTDMTDREVRGLAKSTGRPFAQNPGVWQVYGTDHTATEVVHTRSGATYIRGRMYHRRPRPDHRVVSLDGARWYLAVRNTVPRRRDPMIERFHSTPDRKAA